MENLNVVNDTQQAVVEPAKDCANTSADGTGTLVPVGNAEVASRVQSNRENSGFRKMRLENERYKRELGSSNLLPGDLFPHKCRLA